MAEAILTVGVSSQPAEQGARVVCRALGDIEQSATRVVGSVDNVNESIKALMAASASQNSAVVAAIDSLKKKAEETKPQLDGLREALNGLQKEGGAGLKEVYNAISEIKKAASDGKHNVGQIASAVGELGAASLSTSASLGLVATALGSIYALGFKGSQTKEVMQNFSVLARSMGVDAELALKKMKDATEGEVGTTQMAKDATNLLAKGIRLNAEQIGSLYEISLTKGKLFGQEIGAVFDTIANSSASGMTRGLKQLGFTFDETFDAALMKMSDYEKKQTVVNEVIRQGEAQMKGLKDQLSTSHDGFEVMSVAVAKLGKSMTQLFSDIGPVVGMLAVMISKLADATSWTIKWGQAKAGTLLSGTSGNEWERNLRRDPLRTMTLDEVNTKFLENEGSLKILKDKAEAERKRIKEDRGKGGIALSANTADLDVTNPSDASLRNMEQQIKYLELMRVDLRFVRTEKEELAKKAKEQAEHDLASARAAYASVQASKNQGKASSDLQKELDKEQKAKAEIINLDVKLANSAAAIELSRKNYPEVFEAMAAAADKASMSAAGLTFATIGLNKALAAIGEQGKGMLDLPILMSKIGTEAQKFLGEDWAKSLSTAFTKGTPGVIESQLGELQNWSSLKWVKNYFNATSRTPSTETRIKEMQAGWVAEESDIVPKLQELHDKLKLNVSDAFEQGLYDGLNGGNFLESFGRGLRSQVARALSAGITSQIFGVGGSGGVNLQNILFGGGAGSDYDLANTTAYGPNGESGGGYGSLAAGGVLGKFFKPVFGDAGKFLWKNALSNVGVGLAVGYAADTLFGTGGVFGDARVHGAESITRAGDINAQVAEAKKQQEALLKSAVGVSSATYQAIKNLQLANAYTTEETSGRTGLGTLFKGPKTTTYTLHSESATASLNKFLDLLKKATEESSERTFEVSMTALNDPTKAATMGLNDLKEALARLTAGTEEYRNIQLQVAQGEKGLSDSRKLAQAQNLSNWTSYALGNPFAGYGSDVSPIPFDIWVNHPWSGGDWQSAKTSTIDPAEEAEYAVKYGFTRPELPGGKYRIGNTELDATGLRTYIDSLVMMQGLTNQYEMNLAIKRSAAKAGGLTLDTAIDSLGTKKTAWAGGTNLGEVGSTEDAWGLYNAWRSQQKAPSMGNWILPGLRVEEKSVTYGDLLTKQITDYKKIMDELQKQIEDATLDTDKRTQLFGSFQEAQSSYYAALDQQMTMEEEAQAAKKEKQSRLRDDILGTILTSLGEIKDDGRQKVIVLSPGQPDARAMVKQLRAALSGTNPELITVLDEFDQAYNWRNS